MTPGEIDERIRKVLEEAGRLDKPAAEIGDDEVLSTLGLKSHATVNVMVGLEEAFEIQFPVQLLRLKTFRTISTMREAVLAVLEGATG